MGLIFHIAYFVYILNKNHNSATDYENTPIQM